MPVTTRYYSRWQKKFLFTETNDAERLEYLLRKVYWLSACWARGKPVWIADPRDAQYLNTTEAGLAAHGRQTRRRGAAGAGRRVCRRHAAS